MSNLTYRQQAEIAAMAALVSTGLTGGGGMSTENTPTAIARKAVRLADALVGATQ